MPFQSKAQQRYLFAKNPKVAQEFASKTKDYKDLPEHVSPHKDPPMKIKPGSPQDKAMERRMRLTPGSPQDKAMESGTKVTPFKFNPQAAKPHKPKPDPKAPLGQGGRFEALKEKLESEPGVRDPGAVAASIGRAKYGKAKFQMLAKKGKQA